MSSSDCEDRRAGDRLTDRLSQLAGDRLAELSMRDNTEDLEEKSIDIEAVGSCLNPCASEASPSVLLLASAAAFGLGVLAPLPIALLLLRETPAQLAAVFVAWSNSLYRSWPLGPVLKLLGIGLGGCAMGLVMLLTPLFGLLAGVPWGIATGYSYAIKHSPPTAEPLLQQWRSGFQAVVAFLEARPLLSPYYRRIDLNPFALLVPVAAGFCLGSAGAGVCLVDALVRTPGRLAALRGPDPKASALTRGCAAFCLPLGYLALVAAAFLSDAITLSCLGASEIAKNCQSGRFEEEVLPVLAKGAMDFFAVSGLSAGRSAVAERMHAKLRESETGNAQADLVQAASTALAAFAARVRGASAGAAAGEHPTTLV